MWGRTATFVWPGTILIALLLPSHPPAHGLFHCQIPQHSFTTAPQPCAYASLFPPHITPLPALSWAELTPAPMATELPIGTREQ